MNTKQIYVVRDLVAGESGPLFEAANDGTATRMFRQMLKKQEVNETEFQLRYIGCFSHDRDELVVDEMRVVNTGGRELFETEVASGKANS